MLLLEQRRGPLAQRTQRVAGDHLLLVGGDDEQETREPSVEMRPSPLALALGSNSSPSQARRLATASRMIGEFFPTPR